ncbi:Uncharacterised protein [Vibrio cholerae]|nr:Uncharacterised protein [Vibrio cholerae]
MKKMYGQLSWSHNTPPRIGPMIGATSVVIDQIPIAAWLLFLGNIRIIKVCESGIKGPPTKPSNTRNITSVLMLLAKPQSNEKTPNNRKQVTKTRIEPNREANQPVRGTEIASATA